MAYLEDGRDVFKGRSKMPRSAARYCMAIDGIEVPNMRWVPGIGGGWIGDSTAWVDGPTVLKEVARVGGKGSWRSARARGRQSGKRSFDRTDEITD